LSSISRTFPHIAPRSTRAICPRAGARGGFRSTGNNTHEKKLSVAALSQTLPDRLIEQTTP
jgi:hypothetical protein